MDVSSKTAGGADAFLDQVRQLYDDGALVDGELRYDFLWSLCQLERVCSALARFARNDGVDNWAQFKLLQSEAAKHCRDARAIIEIAAAERKQRKARAASTSRRYIPSRISGALPMQPRASMPA